VGDNEQDENQEKQTERRHGEEEEEEEKGSGKAQAFPVLERRSKETPLLDMLLPSVC